MKKRLALVIIMAMLCCWFLNANAQGEKDLTEHLMYSINNGEVTVNGKVVKPSFDVKTDDDVVVCLPEAIEPEIKAENIPLDILYEDKDVLVVNKPIAFSLFKENTVYFAF